MKGKVLRTIALIFVILIMIFSLSGCDRVKAEIGFKWGQLPMNNHYREVKNSQREIRPAVDINQNITIGTGSGKAFSRPAQSPA
jgi:uncharacterized lipoprotein YehR (DUF1307 family)